MNLASSCLYGYKDKYGENSERDRNKMYISAWDEKLRLNVSKALHRISNVEITSVIGRVPH